VFLYSMNIPSSGGGVFESRSGVSSEYSSGDVVSDTACSTSCAMFFFRQLMVVGSFGCSSTALSKISIKRRRLFHAPVPQGHVRQLPGASAPGAIVLVGNTSVNPNVNGVAESSVVAAVTCTPVGFTYSSWHSTCPIETKEFYHLPQRQHCMRSS